MRPAADRDASERIFVQIASYCDPELAPTIRDAAATADDPDRLVFGICQQYDEETRDQLSALPDLALRLDSVDHRASRGVGWARARANELYEHERWFLQIDAHTRFAPGWDGELIEMARSVPSERPLLSMYPAPYELDVDGAERRHAPYAHPMRMGLRELLPDYTTRQLMDEVPGAERPGRQQLLAAGFLFGPGRFVRDVPYDPHWYFGGEEVALAVRAYTHGYDLYFPTVQVLWHRYHHSAPLHWQRRRSTDVEPMERASLDRRQRLLTGDPTLGRYGLGTARTLRAFERAAGFSFDDSSATTD